MPLFNEYLNVNTPLQIGGILPTFNDKTVYSWNNQPKSFSFEGCIKNFMINTEYFDLASPSIYQNTMTSCSGSLNESLNECNLGWSGKNCTQETIPSSFKTNSNIKFDLNSFLYEYTKIQVKLRTWESWWEILKLNNPYSGEYIVLEVANGLIKLRYNYFRKAIYENDLQLSILINDGQWHSITAEVRDSIISLQIDDADGRSFNESITYIETIHGNKFYLTELTLSGNMSVKKQDTIKSNSILKSGKFPVKNFVAFNKISYNYNRN